MAEQTQLDRIEALLVTIRLQNAQQTALLTALVAGGQLMSAEMDTLQAQVNETLTVEQSAITLIQGIAAQLADAAGDRARSLQLASTLRTSADALAAAVAANTTAAANA